MRDQLPVIFFCFSPSQLLDTLRLLISEVLVLHVFVLAAAATTTATTTTRRIQIFQMHVSVWEARITTCNHHPLYAEWCVVEKNPRGERSGRFFSQKALGVWCVSLSNHH